MPDCEVHYLWFAFVCFLIRSPPPPPSLPPGSPRSARVTGPAPATMAAALLPSSHETDQQVREEGTATLNLNLSPPSPPGPPPPPVHAAGVEVRN